MSHSQTLALAVLLACFLEACQTAPPRVRDASILCESNVPGPRSVEIFSIDTDGSNFVNLSQSNGDDREPAYNAAVQLIAFTSDRTGDWEIFLMDRDGVISEQTTNSPGQDLSPTWKADGSRLAISSERSGNFEIWRMTKSGGTATNLTNDPAFDSEPAWSPTGNRIAFTSNRTGNFEIWLMDATDGGNLVQLTSRPGWNNVDPTWSPDGAQILFEGHRVNDQAQADLFMINADGSLLRPLLGTATPSPPEIEPAWSQDGRQILFTTFTDNAHLDIYTMDVSGNLAFPRQLTTATTDQRSGAYYERVKQ